MRPTSARTVAVLSLLAVPFAASAATVTVSPQPIDDLKSVIATVEPLHQTAARARIGGTLVSLSVREGDMVKAGDKIALVADQKIALQLTALDARILAAEAQAVQAGTEFLRASELIKFGAVSQAALDHSRTTLDVATRTLTALKADREVLAQSATDGAVLAPSAGRVLKLMTTEGSVVLPGETIASLAEDHYILRLDLPERHATSIRAGDPVTMAGRDDAATPVLGTVRIVYPEITGGRVTADVSVPGLDGYFIGERTRVLVPTGKRLGMLVPATAVSQRAGMWTVHLKDGIEVVVQPGQHHGGDVEILSGLNTGDEVMVP